MKIRWKGLRLNCWTLVAIIVAMTIAGAILTWLGITPEKQ